MTEETRVRMGVKHNSKGYVQMDITAEAPTVEKAGELLESAIAEMKKKISNAGLKTVDEIM